MTAHGDNIDFFIVGTSRSGSTLLRQILDDHPDTAVLNESHWLPTMLERAGTGEVALDDLLDIVDRTYWDTGERVIDANLRQTDTTRDAVDRHLRDQLGTTTTVTEFHPTLVDALFNADRAKTVRGDKTPDYGYYMADLQQTWPSTRFVHVLRNGIDTARSMGEHGGCRLMVSYGHDCWVPLAYDWQHRPHHRFRRVSTAACVASWRRRVAAIRAGAEQLRPGTYLEVRYEALLAEPAAVLEQVGEFLSIDADDEWLARSVHVPDHSRRHGDPAFDVGLFAGFEPDDLEMLAAVGGTPDLVLAPDCDSADLERAIATGERSRSAGDHAGAARAGFSVLAVTASQPASPSRAAAIDLITTALSALESKRAARAWAKRVAVPNGAPT